MTRDFDLDGSQHTLAGLVDRCNQFIEGRVPARWTRRSSWRPRLAIRTRTGRSRCPCRSSGSRTRTSSSFARTSMRATTRSSRSTTPSPPSRSSAGAPVSAAGFARRKPAKSSRQRATHKPDGTRRAYFRDAGEVDAAVRLFDALEPEKPLSGPALIESPTTTVVIELGATVEPEALRKPRYPPDRRIGADGRGGRRAGRRGSRLMVTETARARDVPADSPSLDGVRMAVLSNRFEGIVSGDDEHPLPHSEDRSC